MMNRMFILPVRKEPDLIVNSRTSAPDPRPSQPETTDVEKPKGLSFRELLEKDADRKEQKSEKISGSEEAGNHEKRDTKPVHNKKGAVEDSKNVASHSAEKISEGAGLKEKLIKEILSFLEQNRESVKSLKGNLNLPESRIELEKRGSKELKDLLDRLKTDVNILFQAKVLLGQTRDVKTKESSSKKDDRKDVGSLAEKDQAFKVDTSGEKPKFLVNRDKVEVIDKRTSKDSQEMSAKIQNDTLKGGLTRGDELQKKDGGGLTRNDLGSFKDLLAKRELSGMDAKGPLHDVKETNKVFNDIVQHSKLMLQDKKHIMEIELKPDHLGKITLKIEMVDNKLIAQIFAQNESTGDMLKQNMGNMSQSFKDAGLNLQSLDVNVGSGNKDFQQMMGDEVSRAEKMLSLNQEVSDDEREDHYQATGYNGSSFGLLGRQSVDYIV
jgi:flagellar hook-length control protein FliK